MFADDGITLSDSKEAIEKVLMDYKLPIAGIYFSKKLKKDGTPSCGYIQGAYAKFLGADLDFETGVVRTTRGACHFSAEVGLLMKIVWNEYNVVKEWKWENVSGSYLEKVLRTQDLGH